VRSESGNKLVAASVIGFAVLAGVHEASNQNGCTIDTAILLDGPISPYTTTTAGGIGFDASCPVYVAPCRVIYTGTWTR